jgi:hypothetical protein
MEWLKRLFSGKGASPQAAPETFKETNIQELPPKYLDAVALRAAKYVKVPEIDLERLPPTLLNEISRRAAEQFKATARPDQFPASLIEEVARRASQQLRVSENKPADVNLDNLPPAVLDAIARRVIEHLSAKVVQDIAWEVVPELADLMIRKYLAEGRMVPDSPASEQSPSPPARKSAEPSAPKETQPGPAIQPEIRTAPVKEPHTASQNGGSAHTIAVEPPRNVPVAPAAPVQEPVVRVPASMPTPVSREVASPVATQPAASFRSRRVETDLPVAVGTDEEKTFHYDARRYARLLVSELKLYNEQKVTDGRARSNLYEVLREEIIKSREAYDRRVKPGVASKYDYFHDELVKGLAQGDESRLGEDYPGPYVR